MAVSIHIISIGSSSSRK